MQLKQYYVIVCLIAVPCSAHLDARVRQESLWTGFSPTDNANDRDLKSRELITPETDQRQENSFDRRLAGEGTRDDVFRRIDHLRRDREAPRENRFLAARARLENERDSARQDTRQEEEGMRVIGSELSERNSKNIDSRERQRSIADDSRNVRETEGRMSLDRRHRENLQRRASEDDLRLGTMRRESETRSPQGNERSERNIQTNDRSTTRLAKANRLTRTSSEDRRISKEDGRLSSSRRSLTEHQQRRDEEMGGSGRRTRDSLDRIERRESARESESVRDHRDRIVERRNSFEGTRNARSSVERRESSRSASDVEIRLGASMPREYDEGRSMDREDTGISSRRDHARHEREGRVDRSESRDYIEALRDERRTIVSGQRHEDSSRFRAAVLDRRENTDSRYENERYLRSESVRTRRETSRTQEDDEKNYDDRRMYMRRERDSLLDRRDISRERSDLSERSERNIRAEEPESRELTRSRRENRTESRRNVEERHRTIGATREQLDGRRGAERRDNRLEINNDMPREGSRERESRMADRRTVESTRSSRREEEHRVNREMSERDFRASSERIEARERVHDQIHGQRKQEDYRNDDEHRSFERSDSRVSEEATRHYREDDARIGKPKGLEQHVTEIRLFIDRLNEKDMDNELPKANGWNDFIATHFVEGQSLIKNVIGITLLTSLLHMDTKMHEKSIFEITC